MRQSSATAHDALCANIKAAVRCADDCNSDTVSCLSRLLANSIGDVSKQSKELDARSTRRGRATNARGPSEKVTAPYEKKLDLLSRNDKLTLATETFNLASKAMSNYLKRTESSTSRTPKRSPGRSPLKVTSSNRRTTSRANTSPELVQMKPEKKGTEPGTGIVELSNCARIALKALLDLQPPKEGVRFREQLEQGFTVLIGKLIALQLYDAAKSELVNQGNRIATFLYEEETSQLKSDGSRKCESSASAKDDLPGLLVVQKFAGTKQLASLMIAFQQQVLKVVLARKRPASLKDWPSILMPSNKFSPANLILNAYERNFITEDKAIQQLQTLAQTVASLSFLVPKDHDDKMTSRITQFIDPLNLQVISLEIRSLSWTLANHKCDEVKEIWEPLARFYAMFARRCTSLDRMALDVLTQAYVRLKTTLKLGGYRLSASTKATAVSTVFTILAQKAQSVGCLNEAVVFYQKSMASIPSDHPVLMATCRCRIASLYLESLTEHSTIDLSAISNSVSEASRCMGQLLKGSQTELDELIIESAKLKKTVINIIRESQGDKHPQEMEQDIQLSEFVRQFVRVLCRYIGQPLNSTSKNETTAQSEASFQSRLCRFHSIVTSAIDSIILIGKLSLGGEVHRWETGLAGYSDCLTLLNFLRRADLADGAETRKPLGYVRLSNLYWSRYLKLKETNGTKEEQISTLEHCIAILQDSPTPERYEGFLDYKLERLGSLYLDAGHVSKALSAFRSSVSANIDAGVLADAVRDAETMPIWRILKNRNGSGFTLHRALGHYIKLNWRSGNSKFVMDDVELSHTQRAIFLESQLLTVMDLVVSKPNEDYMEKLSVIVRTMMELYPADKHPTRRARVCLQAVRFALNSPGRLDEDLFKAVIRESEGILASGIGHAEDEGLALYRPSIWATLHFFCALCFGHLRRHDVEVVIQGWLAVSQECKSWDDVCARIEEPSAWIAQCQTVVDYLEVRGYWRLRLSALSALARILELGEAHLTDFISCLTHLGLQYCRLGFVRKAAAVLSKARSSIKEGEVKPAVLLRWHLAFAELAIDIGNPSLAWETLNLGRSLFDRQVEGTANTDFHNRTRWERLVADATTIYSRLCLCVGDLWNAISFARLSVKMNNRIWVRLDRYSGHIRSKMKIATPESTSDGENIDERLSRMSLNIDQESQLYREGCIYWEHFSSYFSSLLHLSRLSSRYGLYQDTIYFADQALESAMGIGSGSSVTLARAFLGEQYILSGDVEKGRSLLDTAIHEASTQDISRDIVAFYARISALQQEIVEFEENEQQPTLLAHEAFEKLSAMATEEQQLDVIDFLGQKMDELTIEAGLQLTRPEQQTPAEATVSKNEAVTDSSLLRLRGTITRQEAVMLLLAGETSRASTALAEAETYPRGDADEVSDILMRAKLLIMKAADKLSSHAIYCVLPESTYSLPSVQDPVSHTPQSGGVAKTRRARTRAAVSRRAKSPTNHPGGKGRVSAQDEYSIFLAAAGDMLMGSAERVMRYGSTTDNYQLSHLLSQIQLMQSATDTAPASSMSFLLRAIIENGKQFPFLQESAFIRADKQLAQGFDPLRWPVLLEGPKGTSSFEEDLITQCVEKLPTDWNVVSLTLSSDHNEMIITRLQSGEEPFVLRLPLKRSDSEGTEEDEAFGFEEGKAEITEIIHLANRSAHDTRAHSSGREAKKEWWANREFLDNRIRDFLKNIESLWFGGFRGVFSPKSPNKKLLATFSSSFEKILNKHLPSRRQLGKQKQPHLKVDSAVLDLFTKLDNLDNEEGSEDLVMDLLYFVVDILQFHGERNAYDEIDFDQMVVEVMDAIKAYAEANSRQDCQRDEHTILVLDKELHIFPWESMDFLKGTSISRVPSLQCVVERLAMTQESGLEIGRDSISYILNPGGDLKSTQAKFQPVFSSMPGWSGIVGRAPTEEEFEQALKSKEIVLYFGHGSGAQYIRGRTIRRLDQCAVTFLMGCSSGVLTEARQFEPYGTPINYMHAGARALVATLWDVTDKDIDRFTKTALENWGLIPSTKYLPKSRGQQAATALQNRESENVSVGLDGAISRARDACIFKYLNGAAPVVYGIPIFLK